VVRQTCGATRYREEEGLKASSFSEVLLTLSRFETERIGPPFAVHSPMRLILIVEA
jgi:hypothetical protein